MNLICVLQCWGSGKGAELRFSGYTGEARRYGLRHKQFSFAFFRGNLASYKQIWSVLVGQQKADTLIIWVTLWEVNSSS